jgi:hypothetical protein
VAFAEQDADQKRFMKDAFVDRQCVRCRRQRAAEEAEPIFGLDLEF